MNKLKRTLIIGAGVASVGIAGLAGVATTSALTATDGDSGTSIIDKLVSKFGLNKDEVKAVFDENRNEHMASMKADRAEALKTALSDGKLSQQQYDHIVAVQAEIDKLIESSGTREDQTDEQRSAIKAKFDELRTWFDDQNIDVKDLGIGGGPGGRGDHGPRSDQ